MSNWKEGIDWITDPTGATPLPNHYFVAPWGDDSIGDGSKDNPWQTINYSVSQQLSEGDTLVVYTGEYQEGTLTIDKSLSFIGDGAVTLRGQGTGVSRFGSLNNKHIHECYNISIIGYDIRIGASLILKNGLFIGGKIYNARDYDKAEKMVFINSSIETLGSDRVMKFNDCIFINTSLNTTLGTLPSDNIYCQHCYFDPNCSLKINKVDLGRTIIKWCNIRCNIYDNARAEYIDPTVDENNILNNINADPLFSNIEGGDFSLQTGSPHIGAGYGGKNIGGTNVGQSFSQGASWLDQIIDSSPDLSYSSITGEILVENDVTVESGEFEESRLRYLPILDFYGFPNIISNPIISLIGSDRLIYEADWAGIDGVYSGTWKKFRFGEAPSVDNQGKYNGEDGFRWGQAQKIPAFKRKYRFTFKANGL